MSTHNSNRQQRHRQRRQQDTVMQTTNEVVRRNVKIRVTQPRIGKVPNTQTLLHPDLIHASQVQFRLGNI